MMRASFTRILASKLRPGQTISFAGRDRLHIRLADNSIKQFNNLNWSQADLTRVLADPIFQEPHNGHQA